MNIEAYENLKNRYELYTLISEGLRNVAENKGRFFDEAMAEIKQS